MGILPKIVTLLLAAGTIVYADRLAGEEASADFVVGTGIYDMTGPAAQINFMGYAKTSQTAHGIHMRLRARSFIIAEPPKKAQAEVIWMDEPSPYLRSWQFPWRTDRRKYRQPQGDVSRLDPERTVCFVSIDAGMGSDMLNHLVLQRLEKLLPEQADSGKRLCHLENLSISGTHTHSAPAGFIQYALYQVTSAGFSTEVMDSYVEGISQSILRAYQNLEQGRVGMAKDFLFGANINRSPTSYMLNSLAERDLYKFEGDTDKGMLQLEIASMEGEPKGVINWYAVHGTSMNASNLLISGDNKGYASYLMEKEVNGEDTLPGKGEFVAAFASTNLGDVSPNTAGPRCLDSGSPCDIHTSTCKGKNAQCVAFGPGKDMKESTEIIGRKQFDAAMLLFQNDTEALRGSVGYRHSFIDMSNLTVHLKDGKTGHTCPAALGYAFAAGTTDGPGEFDFVQGQNTSNLFWNMVSEFISPPSHDQRKCHHPKPILLNTGRVSHPYAWDPATVPISVLQIGRVFILNVPCEMTTMAGRRLRGAIRELLLENGFDRPEVTIAGLANSYTHYVATIEEYQGQRYEAASTLYGPHTLSAYIQEFERIVGDLVQGRASESDKAPHNQLDKQISLLPPVVVDTIGLGRRFGSVAINSKNEYKRGNDTVKVSFRSANPRNNQRLEGTFLTVDQLTDDGSWKTRYDDGDWSTTFFWKSSIDSFGVSFAEISWEIPNDTPQGIYRICHFGTRKSILGSLEWLLMHTPDWWYLDFTGSIAGSFLLEFAKNLDMLPKTFREALAGIVGTRRRDFSGCSNSFLVRAHSSNG